MADPLARLRSLVRGQLIAVDPFHPGHEHRRHRFLNPRDYYRAVTAIASGNGGDSGKMVTVTVDDE